MNTEKGYHWKGVKQSSEPVTPSWGETQEGSLAKRPHG